MRKCMHLNLNKEATEPAGADFLRRQVDWSVSTYPENGRQMRDSQRDSTSRYVDLTVAVGRLGNAAGLHQRSGNPEVKAFLVRPGHDRLPGRHEARREAWLAAGVQESLQGFHVVTPRRGREVGLCSFQSLRVTLMKIDGTHGGRLRPFDFFVRGRSRGSLRDSLRCQAHQKNEQTSSGHIPPCKGADRISKTILAGFTFER